MEIIVNRFFEEDGTITLSTKDMDIVANGETDEKALHELAEYLMEYAEAYQENFNTYYNAPNRKDHYPYIKNILKQKDIEGVKSLIKIT